MLRPNFALVNGSAHFKGASPFGDILTNVCRSVIVNMSAFADLTFTDHRVQLRIDDRQTIVSVVVKLKFGFVLLVQNQDRRERFAGFATESVQRSDLAFFYQGADFLRTQRAASYVLEHPESARLAIVSTIVFLQMQSPAFWARTFDGQVSSFDAVALEILGLMNDLPGKIFDFRHEGTPFQTALFHELELIFPFSRELRRREQVNANPAK